MAITRLNASKYIARALGAEGNTTQLAAALDALNSAIQEWNLRRDWRWLRMDTRDGFTIAGCTNAAGSVSTTTTDGFRGVNIGQTFTVSDGNPAGTYTVATVSSTSTITVTGGGGNFTTESLVFSGDIPVIAGTASYNLPSAMKRPMDARMLVNERTLEWKDQFLIDKLFQNQSPNSLPEFYSLFNPTSFSQASQNGKITLFPIPSATETLRVRYYRPIVEPSADGEFLDVPDRYVYALLELARWNYLKNHDAETERMMMTGQKAEALYRQCVADDEGESQDRDMGFTAQIDWASTHQIVSDEIAGWP